jgi:signal transduction histidine kinase
MFAAQAHDAGIEVVTEVEPGLPLLDCDQERVIQVLANLLSNAIKFTPSGGTIRISANRQPDHIAFSVSDTGRGIDARALAHVFDRFWHSKQENKNGHGLGLSIAKGIVNAHGGEIGVQSEEGAGTTFSFSIPFEFDALAIDTSAPDSSEGMPSSRWREFIFVASHELRTPLTALELKLERLLKLVHERDRGRANRNLTMKVVDALRQTDRLTRLIEAMLDASRISTGELELEREEFDLASLTSNVVRYFADDAHAVGSRFDLVAASARGSWDRFRIEQAISSLVANALKHAPQSRIVVRIDADPEFARVTLRGVHSDAGHESVVGTGFYPVREIIQSHGGRLDVDTARSRGTTITVTLPRWATREASA